MIDELKEQPGIYILTNKANYKVYVGESMNIRKRIKQYRNPKSNRPIDIAIRESGLNGFQLEVTYYNNVSREDIQNFERITIEEYQSKADTYNVVSWEQEPPLRKTWTIQQKQDLLVRLKEHRKYKPVLQYSLDGVFIAEYPQLKDAWVIAKACSKSSISNCCNGKVKSAGGFIWKYKQQTISKKVGRLD